MIYKALRKRPYLLLIVASILFLMFYFFLNSDAKTILNIHDTYFVILRKELFLIIFILLGFTSLIYVLLDFFKVNLLKKNIWFHILSLLIMVTFFFYTNKLSDEYDSKKKVYGVLIDPPDFNKYMFVIILVTVSLQFFFIINIFVPLIKKIFRLFKSTK